MTIDETLLAEASVAAGRVHDLEDQLAGAKSEYRRTVRRVHLAGASMREIADALGVSHQRVHQIVDEGGARRWRRRRREEPTSARLCSFCGREQHEIRKLVAGPGVYICDPCIMAAVGVSASGRPAKDPFLEPVPDGTDAKCSFCGKPRTELQSLVSAPVAEPVAKGATDQEEPPTICDECVGLCGEILSEQLR